VQSEMFAALGLGLEASAPDVVRAFRRRAMEVHPDHGGDPEAFKRLVRVRDAALAALEEG
jgi:molecular chaperone DnaJ